MRVVSSSKIQNDYYIEHTKHLKRVREHHDEIREKDRLQLQRVETNNRIREQSEQHKGRYVDVYC